MTRTIAPGLGLLVVGALGHGCTRDNPAYGDGEPMSATSAAGTSASSGLEKETSRGDGTTLPAETTLPDETIGDGTSIPGETHDDTETTDTAGVCARPAPTPFDILSAAPSCQTYTWQGQLTLAGDDFVEVSGCFVELQSEIPTCDCPQTSPFTFTFVGLPIAVQDVLNQVEPCLAITIAYREEGAECVVDWFGARTAPVGGVTHVLAGANREVPALTDPTVTLGSPQCDDAVVCDVGGTLLGPYSVGLDYGPEFLELSTRHPIELEMTVHGVHGIQMLRVLHVGVDESCEPHLGWVAWGKDG